MFQYPNVVESVVKVREAGSPTWCNNHDDDDDDDDMNISNEFM